MTEEKNIANNSKDDKKSMVLTLIERNKCMVGVILDKTRFFDLQLLRELIWESKIVNRLEEADKTQIRYNLQEVMSENEYEEFLKINPNDISDEELFD